MRFKKIFPHTLFVVLVGVFVLLNKPNVVNDKLNLPSSNVEVNTTKETARVLRVIDGDTVEVSLNGKEETVRLIGIDAPEIADPRKTVECFGKESSNFAKSKLDGQTIELESDPTQGNRDKYGRLLRYVFINELNINKLMISEGFAHEYTYQSNPYKYQSEFENAQRKAKENKVGLWSEDNKCYN